MSWSIVRFVAASLVAIGLLTAREAAAQSPRSPQPGRPPTLMPRPLNPIVLEPETDPPDPTRSPPFVLIERFSAVSSVGADVTAINLDGTDDTLFRTQLAGRYVDPVRRVGGYFQLPASFGTGDFDRAIGNLELGGLLLKPNAGGPTNAFIFRAGLTLPTGSLDGDNLRATVVKPGDVYLALPGATSLRLGASTMFRNANVFGRVDLGFDVNLDVRRSGSVADPVLRLNAGFGVDLGFGALMGEVSNAYVINRSGETHEEKLINIAAISLRFELCRALPYVSFIVPFDGDSSEVLDFGFTFGVEAKL